jgi:hypothetical protein
MTFVTINYIFRSDVSTLLYLITRATCSGHSLTIFRYEYILSKVKVELG